MIDLTSSLRADRSLPSTIADLKQALERIQGSPNNATQNIRDAIASALLVLYVADKALACPVRHVLRHGRSHRPINELTPSLSAVYASCCDNAPLNMVIAGMQVYKRAACASERRR